MEKLTVSKYLEVAFAQCGKSQTTIAKELGYSKPNILSMFKLGVTKVPLEVVGPLAKALGIDPAFFFSLVMREYRPDTYSAIEDFLSSGSMLTRSELKLVHLMREEFSGGEVDLDDPRIEESMRAFMRELACKQTERNDAAVDRYARSPANARDLG
ncbi:MAG: hypothetical protein AB9M53_07305 [Leptothrix sp. (in: b-proteobacteria)]